MKKVLPLVLGLAVLLAACGPQAAPTIDAASVQASAVAMAFTMAAETQAAIPTATETPIPTETPTLPPPTPTFELPAFPTAQPTATTASSGGACSGPLTPGWGGPAINLHIENLTKGSLTLSLYLNETPFACGYVSPTIGAKGKVQLTLPEGCYWPSVYINDPKSPAAHSGPLLCMHGKAKITLIVDYPGFRVIWP